MDGPARADRAARHCPARGAPVRFSRSSARTRNAATRRSAIDSDGADLEIRLLGPVEVVRDDRVVAIGGPRIRTLLALLAVRPGTAVGADRLIDELWAGEPPDGAEVTLRTYISRLRTAIGEDVSIRGGERAYAIGLEPDRIDAHRFERLAREGLRSLERRRHRHAAETLGRALTLWRGRPFADLPADGTLQAETVRLEEFRAHTLEAKMEAELELGRAGELVDELERLVAEFPYRERLWSELMLALYRSGRQADALAAYHRARAALDEDLGLEPGPDLRELESAILRQAVPPPGGSAGEHAYALPMPLSTFVGRRRDVDEIATLVGSARLVTLVGVGGVGKTRLGIETARRVAPEFADGAAFVDLSTVADPGQVVQAIASSLGVPERAGEPLDRSLSAYLRDAHLLLVLDNCEHLRLACATSSALLLGAAPGLRILATSREVLGAPGEVAYPVPPLDVPDPDASDETLRNSESVSLLLARASAARHGLRVDPAALRTAARICRDLDGLPLAIELAAARTTALSLDEIAGRLQDRFRFLVSWRRLVSARHRTLREAMDWSYELLAPAERRLLASLSVFAGSFDRRAVAAVCFDGDEEGALQQIERLIEASLVVLVDAGPDIRYRLLETVRQYAAESLRPEETTDLARRHALYVLEVIESAGLTPESPRPGENHDVVRPQLPNIRSALAWAIERDTALGLAIACALERFWTTNSPREGIATFDALLEQPDVPEALRARGHRARGGCRYYLGQFEGGVADYERALAIHRRLGETAAIAHLQLRLAIEAHRRGDPHRALELVGEAAEIAGARRFQPDVYVTEQLLADIASDDGRPVEALERLRKAAALAAAAGDVWWQAGLMGRIAELALRHGRAADAGPAAREALELSRRAGDRQGVIFGLAGLAEEAAQLGHGGRAGRIWGALEAEVDRGGPVGQWELERGSVEDRVRELSGPAFEDDYAAGRALSLDDAIDEALASTG